MKEGRKEGGREGERMGGWEEGNFIIDICVINIQYKCLTTAGRIGPTSHLKKYVQKV